MREEIKDSERNAGMDIREQIAKECDEALKPIGDVPFKEALPYLRECLWELAMKYKTSGAEIFKLYINWKIGYKKKE